MIRALYTAATGIRVSRKGRGPLPPTPAKPDAGPPYPLGAPAPAPAGRVMSQHKDKS